MKTIRPLVLLSLTAVVVSACSKSEQAADTTKAAAATPTPAPAPTLNLADAAGKWNVVATPVEGKDTTSTKYMITATADTAGWMLEFPSGVKVPLQTMVSGDSLMIKTGQFASQRRKNVKVWTEGWAHFQAGSMTGMTTAHYAGAGADSVLHLKITGTKAQ